MGSSRDYVDYVCEQIKAVGALRYRKMFGEYMVYYQDKPVLLVCDNTVFVKKLPAVEQLMADAPCAVPYTGAKEHYILDVEDSAHAIAVVLALEAVTPLPKKRKKKGAPETE